MKLVNTSFKFDRKTRTPEHSNPLQNPKSLPHPPSGQTKKGSKPQNFEKLKAFYEKETHALLKDLNDDHSDQSFSMEGPQEALWHKMQIELMEKKAEIKKIELQAIQTRVKRLESQKKKRNDENFDLILEMQEKMLTMKVKEQERASENRKLKEKIFKLSAFLLNNYEKANDKSISLEHNLPSCNNFNENLSKNPIFDEYFQSSASNLPKDSKEKSRSKAGRLKKQVLVDIFGKIGKIKEEYGVLKDKSSVFKEFFQKNSQAFIQNVSLFLNSQIKRISEKCEGEKKEHMAKVEEENLLKLQNVQEKYDNAAKEQKKKLEQENERNEQINHHYTIILNQKMQEKDDEIAALKEKINEKNICFPGFNHKEGKKKIRARGENNMDMGEIVKGLQEKMEKMRAFYEEKFTWYQKNYEELSKIVENFDKNNSSQTTTEKTTNNVDNQEKKTENIQNKSVNTEENKEKESPKQISKPSFELLETPPRQQKFPEKGEKNTFQIFEEAQSQHLQKKFDIKIKELKLKYEEGLKTLTEENKTLREEKDKMKKILEEKDHELHELFVSNQRMQLEKLAFEEKIRQANENLKDKEYQISVKNTVLANEMGNHGFSSNVKEFKKGMSPLIINNKLNVKKNSEEDTKE